MPIRTEDHRAVIDIALMYRNAYTAALKHARSVEAHNVVDYLLDNMPDLDLTHRLYAQDAKYTTAHMAEMERERIRQRKYRLVGPSGVQTNSPNHAKHIAKQAEAHDRAKAIAERREARETESLVKMIMDYQPGITREAALEIAQRPQAEPSASQVYPQDFLDSMPPDTAPETLARAWEMRQQEPNFTKPATLTLRSNS